MALMRHRLTTQRCLCHWETGALKISRKEKVGLGRIIVAKYYQFDFSLCFFFGEEFYSNFPQHQGPDIVRAILSLQDLCHDPRWLLRSFLLLSFPGLTWLFSGFKEKTYEIYCTYTVTLGGE